MASNGRAQAQKAQAPAQAPLNVLAQAPAPAAQAPATKGNGKGKGKVKEQAPAPAAQEQAPAAQEQAPAAQEQAPAILAPEGDAELNRAFGLIGAEFTAQLNTMNADQLSDLLITGSIKYGIVAARLLVMMGKPSLALGHFQNRLKVYYPTFTVKGPNTKKGECNYPAQRAYNALAYHYGTDKMSGGATGKIRPLGAVITAFVSQIRKEVYAGENWAHDLCKALNDAERAELAMILDAAQEQAPAAQEQAPAAPAPAAQ